MKTPLALLAALALPLAGCLSDECSFDFVETRTAGQTVSAAVPSPPATLALVFVDTHAPNLDRADVPDAVRGALAASTDGRVSLTYTAVVGTSAGEQVALDAVAVGGAVYVFPEGSLGLYRPACSPPVDFVQVDVTAIAVPAGVEAVTVETVGPEGVPDEVYEAARASAAARPTLT